MRCLTFRAVVGICLLVMGVCAVASEASLELLGRLPTVEDVALSPAASRVALISTAGGQRVVAVLNLVAGKAGGKVNLGDQKIRFIQWADEDHLLIVTSTTTVPLGLYGDSREWFVMQIYDVAQQKARPLDFQLRGMRTMNVIGGRPMVRHPEGRTEVFVKGILLEGQGHPVLFKVDPSTLHTDVVAKGLEWETDWLVDGAGVVAAYLDYSDHDQSWSLHLHANHQMTPVASGSAPIEYPSIVGLTPDGASIAVEFLKDGDPIWRPLAIRDGTWGSPIGEGKSLADPIIDERTARIIGGVRVDEERRYVFFDPKFQARWDAIVRAFPDERVRFVSGSDDFSKLVVLVNDRKGGPVYEIVDLIANRADILAEQYEGLAATAEVRHIEYAAGDGMRIPAYLTLPNGRPAKDLPLIVMPHGGPAARDTGDFDWWAQALAAEGYAVLQPNYRGSALSWSFLSAGFGQLGRKMQTDLSDGVRYLAKEGYIDPKRVCIVGGSYGGYAALAGVTLDAGIYRCAVSVAGVSDLKRLLIWSNGNSSFRNTRARRYWDRFMGVTGPRDPALAAISPIDHLDGITAPILLIHGRDDTVVPFEQSALMADGLRRAHKSVEMVTLRAEDHWLSRSETRLQMLTACETFLKANNPPD
ncbi:MAG: prolyl oligopeptidase family protein [Gammaproteobacteria bacterium]|nr:prolyl oligopeptidase family protein [Gammaproteobacteria bacterium]